MIPGGHGSPVLARPVSAPAQPKCPRCGTRPGCTSPATCELMQVERIAKNQEDW